MRTVAECGRPGEVFGADATQVAHPGASVVLGVGVEDFQPLAAAREGEPVPDGCAQVELSRLVGLGPGHDQQVVGPSDSSQQCRENRVGLVGVVSATLLIHVT